MKPILIFAAVVAIAAFIAIVQHRKLSRIHEENARLEALVPLPSQRRDRSATTPVIRQNATPAEIEFFHASLIETLLSFQDRSPHQNPENIKQLLLTAKAFSSHDIARLFELLRNDPRLADWDAEKVIEACFTFFSESTPYAWLEFITENRDLMNRGQLLESAFAKCLRADAKRAIRMFEEETTRRNPDFSISGIRSGVLIALASDDPDKMLAFATSPDFSNDPDALAHLGGFVANSLETPGEHFGFLAALRRAEEKHPDAPLWETMRKEYTRNMAGKLIEWPFESMRLLVDGEFTSDEKWFFAEHASHLGDLNDNGKWADWFAGIDPGERDRWISGRPEKSKHPVITLMGHWGRADAAAASAWLEKLPAGELRTQAVLEHAWTIADRHPERASNYLDELPEGRRKQNLILKIEAALDPARD